MQLFATCAKALESLLSQELERLGAAELNPTRAGVAFSGSLETAYRACLWSRVASRVLLPLATFEAEDEAALYHGVRAIDWQAHLGPDDTLAVDATTSALKVKDAIVDRLRDETGRRPSVDTRDPDLRVNVHLRDGQATVAIDLSGESLHRRGYRARGVEAPLKETLAAALLYLADWPTRAASGAPFVDPMCGSGTLPIEAALMAGDRAPGLGRNRFGFSRWRGHDPVLWERLVAEARARSHPPTIALFGWDQDRRAIESARANARRAAVAIDFAVRSFAEAEAPVPDPGLLVTNPPYGERLGETAALLPFYEQIGDVLRHRFTGWHAFVLTANPELQKKIGLRTARRHVVYNGALECRLVELPIAATAPTAALRPRATLRAEAFANRLRKNLTHRRKWAAREGIHCFRVYDADLPEYAVAVDLYEQAAHVQEYAPPSTIELARAAERLGDVLALVPEVLGIAQSEVYLKQRRRQRPETQYGRMAGRNKRLTVREGGHRFLVNLSDYLDTGLFLDHRRLRAMIEAQASGKRFLNLFCYTGSATVYAAAGGATSSVSVDLSNTYLDWAGENLALNRVAASRHKLVRADVLSFLADERARYDLIFCAPPTFSNSKGMMQDFDLQRDHVALLSASARLLTEGGQILFSNHFRRFKLDAAALPDLAIEPLTAKTLPLDFARDPRFHNSWRITRR